MMRGAQSAAARVRGFAAGVLCCVAVVVNVAFVIKRLDCEKINYF